MKRSIIKTTVDVKASDRLLTLSTCDYTFRDPDTNKLIARLVIFGRALRWRKRSGQCQCRHPQSQSADAQAVV